MKMELRFLFYFCLIKLTFFFITNYLTSCLSTSAESVPESSPIKWSTVKPLSREQSLYFSPRRCILYNLLRPGWNVESLISPDEFPNLTRWVLILTWWYCSGSTWSLAGSHRDYGKRSWKDTWGRFLLVCSWKVFAFLIQSWPLLDFVFVYFLLLPFYVVDVN